MALSGVRSSCDMTARNSLFARLACSAAARAASSAARAWYCASTSAITAVAPTRCPDAS